MSACEQIQDELSAYLDGELSSQERAAVDAHLNGCAACQTVLVELKEVKGALGDVPKLVPPATLAASIRDEIRNGQPAATAGKVVSAPVPWGARIFSAPAIVGLAALVMIGVLVFAVLPRLERPDAGSVAVAEKTAAPATTVEKTGREKGLRAEPLKDDEAPAGSERQLNQDAVPHASDAPARPSANEEDRLEGLAKESDRGFGRQDQAEKMLQEEATAQQQPQHVRPNAIGAEGGLGGGAGASGNAAKPQRESRKALKGRDADEPSRNAPTVGAPAPKPQDSKAAGKSLPAAPPAAAAAPAPSIAPGNVPVQEWKQEKAESNNVSLRGADTTKAKDELAAQRKIEDAANRSGGQGELKKADAFRDTSRKEAEQLETRRNLARDDKPAAAAAPAGKANQLQNGAAPVPHADDKAGKLAQDGAPGEGARIRATEKAASIAENADKAPAAKAGIAEAAKKSSPSQELEHAASDAKKRSTDDQHVESKRPTGPARAGEKKDGETAPAFTDVREFGDALTIAPADIPETKAKMEGGAKGAANQKSKVAAEASADEPLVIRSDRAVAENILRELAQKFGAEIAYAGAAKEERAAKKDAKADNAEDLAKGENPNAFRLTILAAQKDAFIAELRRRTAVPAKDDPASRERQLSGAGVPAPDADVNKLEEQDEKMQSNQAGQAPTGKPATVELVIVVEPPEGAASPAAKTRARE